MFTMPRFGHIKTYCIKAYYCVKCADNHLRSVCKESKDNSPTCVLCNGPHPANYKGCIVYKSTTPTNKVEHHCSKKTSTTSTTIYTHEYRPVRENLIYLQAVEANTQQLRKVNRTTSKFLDRFENMFNQLINQNSTIINLLTTLIKNSQNING